MVSVGLLEKCGTGGLPASERSLFAICARIEHYKTPALRVFR